MEQDEAYVKQDEEKSKLLKQKKFDSIVSY